MVNRLGDQEPFNHLAPFSGNLVVLVKIFLMDTEPDWISEHFEATFDPINNYPYITSGLVTSAQYALHEN